MHINKQHAKNGMVSSSCPLATMAALQVLQDGGNAIDAGICASALLNVTLPMSCGLGGDVALLIYLASEKKTYSVTSLGAAPAKAFISNFLERGYTSIPRTGILSATIPATIEAYLKTHSKFCVLPLQRLLSPAIYYAENGFIVSPQLNRWIKNNQAVINNDPALTKIFIPNGEVIATGSQLYQKNIGRVYRQLCAHGQKFITDDWLLQSYMQVNRQLDGFFSENDFYKEQCYIETPLEFKINNYTIITTPLPTQGYLLLQNLRLYEKAYNENKINSLSDKTHVLSEIFNQTYWQRLQKAGDPNFIGNQDFLLNEKNIDSLYQNIDFEKVTSCKYAGFYSEGDTTYFNIIDKDGNAVSWIQSLSLGFGAGISVPETGIIFNSRLGRSCTLNPNHPNVCQPGKRPINTIFPYMVYNNNELSLIGGTPGGDGQAQWNTALLSSFLIENQSLQQAISAPRWTYFPGADLIESNIEQAIYVDESFCKITQAKLQQQGHILINKKKVSGAIRLIQNNGSYFLGMDDGREEGLTLGY